MAGCLTPESMSSVTLSADSSDSETFRAESTPSRSATSEHADNKSVDQEDDGDFRDELLEILEIDVLFRPVVEDDIRQSCHELREISDTIFYHPQQSTYKSIKTQVRNLFDRHFRDELFEHLDDQYDDQDERLNVDIQSNIVMKCLRPMEGRFNLSCAWSPDGRTVGKQSWVAIREWLGENCRQPWQRRLRRVHMLVENTITIEHGRS